MRIKRAFWGSHIDLDHILMITEPKFLDLMGRGGYFVEFSIQFMSLPDTTVFRWSCKELFSDEQIARESMLLTRVAHGSSAHRRWVKKQALLVLNIKVAGLINDWKNEIGELK